ELPPCDGPRGVRRQLAMGAKGAHALLPAKAKANVVSDRIALAAHSEALHRLAVAVVPKPLSRREPLHRALGDPPEHSRFSDPKNSLQICEGFEAHVRRAESHASTR